MTKSAVVRAPGARRALGWSFANAALGKLGSLLVGVIIARVLGPDEFGTYAIALVALMAVLSFNELGVSLAIVRWPEDPRRIAPTVTTISVAASTVVFIVGWLLAPTFAGAMGDASAAPVVQVMLICVPLNGLVATAAAILQRDFQQGKRTVADQVNTWLGAGVSVSLAVGGWGAMSLAIGRVVATVVFSVMLVAFARVSMRFGWDRARVGELLRFGLPLAGASIVVFAVGYTDQLILGGLLGAQALGFYVLAANLAGWPVAMLSQPVRAVAPAAFARVQDDPVRMDESFRAAWEVLLSLAFPLCAAIAGAAVPIVRFVYGEEWTPAALALQWLALYGAVRIGFELSYDFLAIRRRSTTLMGIQAAWLGVLIPALLIGAHIGGVEGVATAQAVVAGIVLVGGYVGALVRAGIHFGGLVRATVVPVAAGGVAWVSAVLLSRTITPDAMAALAAALTAGVIGVVALVCSRRSVATLVAAREASA